MKKTHSTNVYFLMIIGVCLLVLTACNSSETSSNQNGSNNQYNDQSIEQDTDLKFLNADEIQQQLGTGPDSLFVLDVRYAKDYNESHLEGTMNIPFAEVADRMDELPIDQEIAVVCYVGKSAQKVAKNLNNAGYNAVVVTGGFEAIEAAGLDLIQSPSEKKAD